MDAVPRAASRPVYLLRLPLHTACPFAKDREDNLLSGCSQEEWFSLFAGVPIGCFPDLYKALSGNVPDQVITL
jgi:hypothetical protein